MQTPPGPLMCSVSGFLWPLAPEASRTQPRIPLSRCPQESVLSCPYGPFQLDLKLCHPGLPGVTQDAPKETQTLWSASSPVTTLPPPCPGSVQINNFDGAGKRSNFLHHFLLRIGFPSNCIFKSKVCRVSPDRRRFELWQCPGASH